MFWGAHLATTLTLPQESTLIVSFHPLALGSVPPYELLWPPLLRTWNCTRWRWIGCVSPVLLSICHTSVAPTLGFSVTASSNILPLSKNPPPFLSFSRVMFRTGVEEV